MDVLDIIEITWLNDNPVDGGKSSMVFFEVNSNHVFPGLFFHHRCFSYLYGILELCFLMWGI